MAIKHSSSIFISRFGLVYKIVIYFLIVGLVVAAISMAVLASALSDIWEEMRMTGFFSHFKEGFSKLFHGDGAFLEEFRLASASYEELGSVWDTCRSQVTMCIVTAVVALFVTMFLLAISFYPFSDIISNYMSSRSDYGFMSNLVTNGGRAVVFALFYTFTVFLCSLGILVFSIWICVLLIGKIGFFALTLSFLLFNLLMSFRAALTAGWLPAAVVERCGIAKGFSVGLKAIGKSFPRAFWTFFFLNLLALSIIPLFGLLTFGIGFIIAIPSAFILYRIAELVLYYDAKSYRYYVDKQTVIE